MSSIIDRFKSIISKNAQQTAKQYNQAIYNWLGESIVWNPENDDSYITEGYRKNATIYALINLITKAATTIPFQVYEKTNENDYKRYKAMTSGAFDASIIQKAKILQKRSLIELEDTELHELLERPNPAQSYNSFITELIAFGKLTGNRYIYGIGPETGPKVNKYTELYVMPSQIMEIVSGGIMQPVSKYKIEYNGTFEIPASEICHIKDFNPYYDGTGSHLYGQSPLRAGLRSLTTNNEAVQTGVKYLQNQTARGLLMSDDGDINEVQAQQLKDKFKKQFQGSNNAGEVIITPKKLSWVNFGLNAADVSLIEQYNASIKDLCNIYNVPVQLLNNTDSASYNNMKEAKKALYQNAVIPELLKIKDELNRWLSPKYGNKLCIEFDFSVIPELQEETDKVVDQLLKAWWITPNEKRAAMNYGIDENQIKLDDYYIPANLIPSQMNEIDLPIENINVDVDKFLNSNFKKKNSISKAETFTDYPQTATNNAKRMIEWREKYGNEVQAGTPTGWKRASMLANREPLTIEMLNRVKSFFARHEGNQTIADQYKNTPWKDNGFVSWNLWGGTAMRDWVNKKLNEINE